MIFLVVFGGWFILGAVITVLSGYISQRQLKKYYPTEDWKHEMDRDLTIKNMAEGYDEPTLGKLALNALFWPITLFYAHRGQKRLIREFEEKE